MGVAHNSKERSLVQVWAVCMCVSILCFRMRLGSAGYSFVCSHSVSHR